VNTRLLARWAGPLLVVAFLATVGPALLRTVPDEVDTPLTPLPRILSQQQLTPIPVLTSQSGVVTRQLSFIVGDRVALAKVDQFRLMIDGYALGSRMVSARLELQGTGCVFVSPSRILDFGTVLTLTRHQSCDVSSGPGRAALTMRFTARSPSGTRVGLWAAPSAAGEAALLAIDGAERATPVGHATYRRSAARVRASALLAWMWNIPERWLWICLSVGGVFLIAGAGLAVMDMRPLRAAGSAFCLATGLALVYAVVVPPLQAPDEPDHLLSFSVLTGRAAMPSAEAAWAQRVHFDRIAFRTGERFTPADRDTPWYRPWSSQDVFAEDVLHRSSTATRFWQGLSRVVSSDPPRVLLNIRLANALAFGLAFGAGAAVLATAGAAAPAVLALMLLAIPALPFFAVQMSEITWNIVAVILIGYAAAAVLSNPDAGWPGLLLGAAAALLAAGTRAGWPMGAAIAAVAAARIVSRSPESGAAPWFWVGFVVPTCLLFGGGLLRVATPWYNQWHLPGFDPRVPVRTMTVMAATAIAGLVGFGVERAWVFITRRMTIGLTAFRLVTAAMALWMGLTLLLSMFVPLPSIPGIEGTTSMGLREYVVRMLMSVLTTPRAAGADFFGWTTFLSGFGWIDTFVPQRLLTALTVVGALAAMWLLTVLSGEKDGRRSATVAVVSAGIIVSVIGSGIGAYGLNRNLHGRYLLGPYLVGIALLCSGPALLPIRRIPAAVRTFVLLAAVLAVHVVAIWVVVGRYFR